MNSQAPFQIPYNISHYPLHYQMIQLQNRLVLQIIIGYSFCRACIANFFMTDIISTDSYATRMGNMICLDAMF
jgi:hypothetical protein